MNFGDSQLAAALFGAGIAFVFMRVAEWLTAWYRHQLANHGCLLGLEVTYRQYRVEVRGLLRELEDTQKKRNILSTLILGLSPLPEPPLPATDLHSLDLMNRLASHWACTRKVNATLLSIQKGRMILEANAMGQSGATVDPEAFHDALLKAIGELLKFARELDNITCELIACVGVLLRTSAPPFLGLYETIHPRWVPDQCQADFHRKVAEELQRVQKEFEKCDKERALQIARLAQNPE